MTRRFSLKSAGGDDVFSNRLREIMNTRGENQKTLASKTGVQRQTISLYLNGQSKPDSDRLAALCRALDVSADYLLGLSDIGSTSPNIKAICSATGLSEKAAARLVLSNSRAKGLHNKQEDDGLFELLEHIDSGVLSIDSVSDLLSSDCAAFFEAVENIKRSTEAINDMYDSYRNDESLGFEEVNDLYKDLRVAVFELSDSVLDCADELYSYKDSLEKCRVLFEFIQGRQSEWRDMRS
ncbi:MAG: helix-turn-helix transcriptional regulator [Oscillospiraceae bacterium]|nr:helix-turn-helix transcriptional regulator [Oscillospiraceae bacterium]